MGMLSGKDGILNKIFNHRKSREVKYLVLNVLYLIACVSSFVILVCDLAPNSLSAILVMGCVCAADAWRGVNKWLDELDDLAYKERLS